jgi:hypothetical protein
MSRRAKLAAENKLLTDHWLYHLWVYSLQVGLGFPCQYVNQDYALAGGTTL